MARMNSTCSCLQALKKESITSLNSEAAGSDGEAAGQLLGSPGTFSRPISKDSLRSGARAFRMATSSFVLRVVVFSRPGETCEGCGLVLLIGR